MVLDQNLVMISPVTIDPASFLFFPLFSLFILLEKVTCIVCFGLMV